jgi:hypothetical protein
VRVPGSEVLLLSSDQGNPGIDTAPEHADPVPDQRHLLQILVDLQRLLQRWIPPHWAESRFWRGFEARIPALCLLICCAAVLLSGLLIISKGYLPPDDALRHAAYVESGKTWEEILVMRPDFRLDMHDGWHRFLRGLQRLGVGRYGLVQLPVVALLAVCVGLPLFVVRRPEIWLASSLVLVLVNPGWVHRLSLGRSFLLYVAITMVWCLKAAEGERRPWRRSEYTLFFVLFLVAAFVRSTWFLLLPLVAIHLLIGEYRRGAALLGCLLGATFLAGLLLGIPLRIFWQPLSQVRLAAQWELPAPFLVTELQPGASLGAVVLFLLVIAAVGFCLGGHRPQIKGRGAVLLLLVGCVLIFRSKRFYIDYGIPAMLCWGYLQLADWSGRTTRLRTGVARLATALVIAAVFVLSTSTDVGARWSGALQERYLDASKPDHARLLPDPGGIFYSNSMGVFYRTFFHNPHADWRYVLGMEAAAMTEENRRVYTQLALSAGSVDALSAWVKAMTPADRMVLLSGGQPKVEGLDWGMAVVGIWVGRKTATADDVPAQGSTAAIPEAPKSEDAPGSFQVQQEAVPEVDSAIVPEDGI